MQQQYTSPPPCNSRLFPFHVPLTLYPPYPPPRYAMMAAQASAAYQQQAPAAMQQYYPPQYYMQGPVPAVPTPPPAAAASTLPLLPSLIIIKSAHAFHFLSCAPCESCDARLALQMQPFDSQQTMWVSPNGQPVLMYNGGQVLQRAHALSWLLSIARAAGECVCHAPCADVLHARLGCGFCWARPQVSSRRCKRDRSSRVARRRICTFPQRLPASLRTEARGEAFCAAAVE
jgi:hypothetical protein